MGKELEFDFNNNNIRSTFLSESADTALQPDDDEPRPILCWLYGSPDQATLERCRKVTELSKTLKYVKYDN